MKHLRKVCLVALGWSLLGCDPPEPSDEGQYNLAVSLGDRLGTNSRRVLVGSTFTVEIVSATEDELEHDDLLCATQLASGSLTKIDTYGYTVAGLGPGAVEFAAPSLSCPETEAVAELGPDSWSMVSVDPGAATARWVPTADSGALEWESSPGPAQEFPDWFGRPQDELRVAGEHLFEALPVLIETSVGPRAEVRWGDPSARLEVPGHFEELTTVLAIDGEVITRERLEGSMHEHESFESTLVVAGHEFAMPLVQAVPVTEIASMELVPVYAPSDTNEREWGPPLGVIAVARDGEGRRILGAPVEWSVTRGRVATELLGPSGDALVVADCRDEPKQPRWRGATVEARLDDIVASVDFEWVALPTDEIDPTSEQCTGSACDCSSTASPRDSMLATLALLGLGGLLRRRHSSRRSAASAEARWPPPNSTTCTSSG